MAFQSLDLFQTVSTHVWGYLFFTLSFNPYRCYDFVHFLSKFVLVFISLVSYRTFITFIWNCHIFVLLNLTQYIKSKWYFIIYRSSFTFRGKKRMNSRTIGNVIELLMWRLENFITTSAARIRKKAPKKVGRKNKLWCLVHVSIFITISYSFYNVNP